MTKERIFVSFEYHNDKGFKDFTTRQTKFMDSPFEVFDHSLKEAELENDWERKARSAINILEIVLGKVDTSTYHATCLLNVVRMVHESKTIKDIVVKDVNYITITNKVRLYSWN